MSVGKVVNQRELCEIFGVSDETVRSWQAEGLPYVAGENGRENEYATSVVILWLTTKALCKHYGHPWPLLR